MYTSNAVRNLTFVIQLSDSMIYHCEDWTNSYSEENNVRMIQDYGKLI